MATLGLQEKDTLRLTVVFGDRRDWRLLGRVVICATRPVDANRKKAANIRIKDIEVVRFRFGTLEALAMSLASCVMSRPVRSPGRGQYGGAGKGSNHPKRG
jgi:hypothetical protein